MTAMRNTNAPVKNFTLNLRL